MSIVQSSHPSHKHHANHTTIMSITRSSINSSYESRHYYSHIIEPIQSSGSADALCATDAPGSSDLYECSKCKRKLANRKGAFDKKMQQRIRDKKRRSGQTCCHVCNMAGCAIVHDLVCARCASSPSSPIVLRFLALRVCVRLQNVTLETLPRAERENWQKMRFFPHSAAQGHQTRKRIPASLGICRCWPWGAVSRPNCETRGRKSQKS